MELERKDPRKMNKFQGAAIESIITNAAGVDDSQRLVPDGSEYRRLDEMYRHWSKMPYDKRVYLGVYPDGRSRVIGSGTVEVAEGLAMGGEGSKTSGG